MFDELIIAVGDNQSKDHLFTGQERVDMISRLFAEYPRVSVVCYSGLTVEFARSVGADVMLRGLRNLTDVQYEFQLAMTNRAVAGIETVFVMTSEQYGFVSSTMIREVATLDGDVSALIPELVYRELQKRLKELKG